VEAFDVVENVGLGVDDRQISTPMNTFALEHAEEAFRGRVVAAMSDLAHAADDAVVGKEVLIVAAGELGGFNRSSQRL